MPQKGFDSLHAFVRCCKVDPVPPFALGHDCRAYYQEIRIVMKAGVETRSLTSVRMVPLKRMSKHKRRWNSLIRRFSSIVFSSLDTRCRKVNPMPRITPIRHAVAKLPRLADVHHDLVQVEFPRYCEAPLHVCRLEGV